MTAESAVHRVLADSFWTHRAIQVALQDPFQLSSGNFTPLYVNARLLISYPAARSHVTAFAHARYHERQLAADCIAGGETAGMPFGAWLADRLDKPFVYVRKKRKSHGTGGQVEGHARGEVLLFEDLITDGGSKMAFIQGLREAGCTISHCLVILDREQGGAAALATVGVELDSLVTITACLEVGQATGALRKNELTEVMDYLADPRAWHERRGLPFAELAPAQPHA